jgi:diguanylate cyclase (GGDEF)-like protein
MPAGSIALYDNRNGCLTLRTHEGLSREFTDKSTWVVTPGGLTDQLLRRDEILFVEDTEKADFFHNPLALKEGIRSLICIPLVTKGGIHGILYLDDFAPRSFNRERVQLISVLASFAAMAIENARFHQETHQNSIIDVLTGLYNRRYFEQVMNKELERSLRFGPPLALLMIDVDNFKKFNDTFGHPMGDRILATIGNTLTKTLRSIDYAFRYGGEEFVILLTDTNIASARKAAERVRQRVMAETRRLMRADDTAPITVSTGIAICPRDAETAGELISLADGLLYQAKGLGKNRILFREETNR